MEKKKGRKEEGKKEEKKSLVFIIGTKRKKTSTEVHTDTYRALLRPTTPPCPPSSSFSCYISSLVFTWLLVGIGRTVQRCFDRDKKRQGKETLLACRIYMRWRSRRTKGKGKTREGSESSNEPSDSLRYELRRPTNGPYDGPKSTSLYAVVHLEEQALRQVFLTTKNYEKKRGWSEATSLLWKMKLNVFFFSSFSPPFPPIWSLFFSIIL